MLTWIVGVSSVLLLLSELGSAQEESNKNLRCNATPGTKYVHSFLVRGRAISAEYDRAGVFRCDDPRVTAVQVFDKCLDQTKTKPDEWRNGPPLWNEESVVVTLFYNESTERITLCNPLTVL